MGREERDGEREGGREGERDREIIFTGLLQNRNHTWRLGILTYRPITSQTVHADCACGV